MQRIKSLIVISLSVVIFSCTSKQPDSNESSAPSEQKSTTGTTNEAATPVVENPQNSPSTATQTPTANKPARVNHYICSNNCAGSGGDTQGKCPVCGKDYIHNDAFHANDPPMQAPTITSAPANSNTQNITIPAPTTGSSTGKFHYVCGAGCGGGGDAQGNCPSCGKPMVHNDDFHK